MHQGWLALEGAFTRLSHCVLLVLNLQELLEFSLAHQSQLAGDGELFGYDDDGEGYAEEVGGGVEGGLALPPSHWEAAAATAAGDGSGAAAVGTSG